MKKLRFLIPALIVVFSAGGFILIGGFRGAGSATEFQLSEVKRGNLQIVITSTGTLNALQTVKVGAEVSGTLKKVYVDYNDTVKKGELLALVDPTSFEAAVKEAKAEVSNAEAALEKIRAEYSRKEKLFEKGYISEFEFISLKSSLKAAEAGFLSAEAKLTRAEVNLENTKIRSPISGTVIKRSVDEGQTIASSFQAPELFIIAEDLKKMQIEADVDENDIGMIKKGQEVRFTVQAYPDRIFSGKVRQVRLQPETIQNVVNYTVVIDVPNEEGILLPGMTATIDFIILNHKNVLLVPNSALSFKPPLPSMPPDRGAKLFNLNFISGKKERQGASRDKEGNRFGTTYLSEEDKNPGTSPNPGEAPPGKARVFYHGEDGQIRSAIFTPGETDGIYTEVLEPSEFREGMKVITGITNQVKKKASASRNLLFPTSGSQGAGGPAGPPPIRF